MPLMSRLRVDELQPIDRTRVVPVKDIVLSEDITEFATQDELEQAVIDIKADAYIVLDTFAALESYTNMKSGSKATITSGGRAGDFVFESGDRSANVAGDPGKGVWVAPASAPTGASGAWRRVLHHPNQVRVSYFGGTEGANINTPLRNAINYAKANGWMTVITDLKAASITETMPNLNTSFDAVRIYGMGMKATTLNIASAGDMPFRYEGGSGQVFGECFGDMNLVGGTGQILFSVKGFGGAVFARMKAKGGIFAELSNDIGPGTFTEFVLIDACDIEVNSVYKMIRGAGNDSFHGCGITDKTIVNQRSGTVNHLYRLGGPADFGRRIVWYNAPIGGTYFIRNSDPGLIGYDLELEGEIVTTSGNIRIESFGASSFKLGDFRNGCECHHTGTVNVFSPIGGLGTMVLCDAADVLDDGSLSVIKKPQASISLSTTGSLISPPLIDIGSQGALVMVSLSATNYEYSYLLYASPPFGAVSGFVNIVSTGREFNTAGYGTPSFSVDESGRLTASNAAYAGVSITMRVTLLDGGDLRKAFVTQ